MLDLALSAAAQRQPLRILCLGAHCDDIDIGCGGALLALTRNYKVASVAWVAVASTPERERELRKSASRFLRAAQERQVIAWTFRDAFFPAQFHDIKESFETLKEFKPDVVFTHQRSEWHQDHRLVNELTWNTFRSHLILEYEIPKYEGGLTTPNVYVPLTAADVERKIKILLDSYPSQRRKAWFTADTFRALARLRGVESGGPTGWAEGFHVSKLLMR